MFAMKLKWYSNPMDKSSSAILLGDLESSKVIKQVKEIVKLAFYILSKSTFNKRTIENFDFVYRIETGKDIFHFNI